MSVTSIELATDNPMRSTTNRQGQTSYSITYIIETDALDHPKVIEAALPYATGDPFTFNGYTDSKALAETGSVVIKGKYEEGDTVGWIAEATINFSQLENSQIPTSPLDSPAKRSFKTENQEEVINFEIDSGNLIANIVGDPYDPPVTRRVAKGRLTITQNESAFNPSLLSYLNTINTDAFLGFPAGWICCVGVGADGPNYQNDIQYDVVQYEFLIDPNGFDKQVLNAGMRELDDAGKLQPIKVKGETVSTPIALDANGKAITDNVTPTVKRTHSVYGEAAFASAFYFRG
jgi:hypothetical protein